jgi:DNA mismatch repair protein MutS
MVEMKETADLLRAAGPRSLLVLDEIGRGTSTYDGLSLAQAILEHLLTRAPAMTLFATHYHELTALESEHPRLKNAHMRIMDGKTGIEFLYVLNSGPAERSYGVQVARLAGLPASVVTRAARLLAELEEGRFSKGASQMELWRSAPLPARTAAAAEPSRSDVAGRTMSAVNEEHAILAQEMLALAIDELRPIDALAKLAAWKDRLLKARARDESH